MAVIGFSVFSLSASAQQNIPQAAKNTIAKSYPGVKNIKWDVEETNYEAGFVSGGKHLSVLLDKNGSVLETETDIAVKALPAAATAYLQGKFGATLKITEAAMIKKANGKMMYEAEVKGKDYLFDDGGKPIK